MDYSNIEFEIIEGYRQGSQLLHSIKENEIYCKNKRLQNGDTRYSCRSKNCNAKVYLNEGGSRVSSKPEWTIHNHACQINDILKMKVHSEIKQRATILNAEPRKIFNDVLAE